MSKSSTSGHIMKKHVESIIDIQYLPECNETKYANWKIIKGETHIKCYVMFYKIKTNCWLNAVDLARTQIIFLDHPIPMT